MKNHDRSQERTGKKRRFLAKQNTTRETRQDPMKQTSCCIRKEKKKRNRRSAGDGSFKEIPMTPL
jgi:hypothetical protein